MTSNDLNQEENPKGQASGKTDRQQDNVLSNCSPVTGPDNTDKVSTTAKIRRNSKEEAFARTGQPIHVACAIDRKRDEWGNYKGEDYFPLTGEVQGSTRLPIRDIAFHPCVSTTGERFIFPQKLDPIPSMSNSWNSSMADALEHPPGTWIRINSDHMSRCYHHEVTSAPAGIEAVYPDFEKDLNEALAPNIIDTTDHPELRRLENERRISQGREVEI